MQETDRSARLREPSPEPSFLRSDGVATWIVWTQIIAAYLVACEIYGPIGPSNVLIVIYAVFLGPGRSAARISTLPRSGSFPLEEALERSFLVERRVVLLLISIDDPFERADRELRGAVFEDLALGLDGFPEVSLQRSERGEIGLILPGHYDPEFLRNLGSAMEQVILCRATTVSISCAVDENAADLLAVARRGIEELATTSSRRIA